MASRDQSAAKRQIEQLWLANSSKPHPRERWLVHDWRDDQRARTFGADEASIERWLVVGMSDTVFSRSSRGSFVECWESLQWLAIV
jgi:hypothetical protein